MDPEQLPLRDLHLPEGIGLWPLAPGWWLLIALIAAALLYFIVKRIQHWRQNASRRLALGQLARIRREYESGKDVLSLSKELSELLRRGMLAYAPRAEVAGLTGEPWFKWLDRGLEGEPFSSGAGRNLESLPYQRPETVRDEIDISALIETVAKRLQTPLPRAGDAR